MKRGVWWNNPFKNRQRKGKARGTVLLLWQTLLHQGPEVVARFSHYYTQLRTLPRHTRRALAWTFRWDGARTAPTLASLALLLALGYDQAGAATVNVSGGNVAALIQAINNANSMSGANTIVLDGSTFTLTARDNLAREPLATM